ncbi:putative PBPb domain-containing protein [Gammaproteobacteria bacterium]
MGKHFFKTLFILGIVTLSSCARVDLPPVPPILPYQPSALLAQKSKTVHEILVAIPENKPPYFNGMSDDGIERDIIQESFSLLGKSPNFIETADRKKKYDASENQISCVSTISEEYKLTSESYFSDPVISYYYKMFTLKKKNIVLNSYDDLAGKAVEAFSSGTTYLGEDFKRVIPKMLTYSEHINRSSQVALLLLGRVDVLIIDHNMFHFIRKNLLNTRREAYDGEVTEAPIEKKMDLKIACHNKETVEGFNKGLSILRSTGRYQAIFEHYLPNFEQYLPNGV